MQDPALDASDAVVSNLEQRWNSVRNNDLINLAMHVIPSLLGADRCSLFLIQPETQDVWLEAGTGVKSRQITVGVHASMVGDCILKGRSIRRDNLQSSEGAHQTIANQQNYLVSTALTVPIRPEDGVAVGALQALNKHQGCFDDRDEETLTAIARLMLPSIRTMYENRDLVSRIRQLETEIETLKLLQATR